MIIKIQEVRQDDLDDLGNYAVTLYRELFGDKSPLNDEQARIIVQHIREKSPRHWAFVIKVDDETAGIFTMAESFSFFAYGYYGIINELWVSKKYRSQDISGRIIDFIKAFAAKRGWMRMDVSVPAIETGDAAVRFYERSEFEAIGRKLKYMVDKNYRSKYDSS